MLTAHLAPHVPVPVPLVTSPVRLITQSHAPLVTQSHSVLLLLKVEMVYNNCSCSYVAYSDALLSSLSDEQQEPEVEEETKTRTTKRKKTRTRTRTSGDQW